MKLKIILLIWLSFLLTDWTLRWVSRYTKDLRVHFCQGLNNSSASPLFLCLASLPYIVHMLSNHAITEGPSSPSWKLTSDNSLSLFRRF